MSRLKAIGQSPLTPWIGAALAAVGAAALIGFSLVARVTIPNDAPAAPTQVRSGSRSDPGEIVLPSPPAEQNPEAPFAPTGPGVTTTGSLTPAFTPAPTSGLEVTSPPIAPVPVDDGLGVRPGTGSLRPPSVNGGSSGGGPDKVTGNGKGPGWKKDSYDGGRDGSIDGPSLGSAGKSYDKASNSKAPQTKAPKATGTGKSKAHSNNGHGHEKSKGKGHSKHRH